MGAVEETRKTIQNVPAAIDRLRTDMPLLVRNTVREEMSVEKQRMLDKLQNRLH